MSFRTGITRRQFVKGAAIAGGAAMMTGLPPFLRNAYAYATSMPLQKFIDRMPLWGSDIPLAGLAPTQPYTGVDYYTLTAGEYRQQLHSKLPDTGTRLYGYADHTGNHAHLGGAVLATSRRPVRIKFASALPATHILPFDASVPSPGNGGKRQDRAAIHLHGGLVPWASDGGPFHWESNPANGGYETGASVIPWLWDGTLLADGVTPDLTKKVWDYFYPNNQSARLMWYHDHAMGITRLNAYAGVATGYIVQDGLDNMVGGVLQNVNGIPFFGQPIVFQDKVFWDPANDPTYPTVVTGVQPGDLWYPWFYDPAIWPIAKGGNPPTPSAIPEFFGDTMLANGHVYPFHEVGVGDHRFRLLNACNARWLDLSFVQEDPRVPGEPLLRSNGRPVAAANVDVWQIGTEGGFLPVPVQLVAAGLPVQPFLLGPAERADIIVRFRAPAVGASPNIILYNVAGSPFPGGAPIFDWYVGNKKQAVPTAPGFGPNTRTIMQFRVTNDTALTMTVPASIPVPSIPTMPDLVNGGLMVDEAAFRLAFPDYTYDPAQIPESLTLNEVVEPPGFIAQGAPSPGRLLTLIGNTAAPVAVPFGAGGIYYTEAPTEFVQYNTLRIWKVFNFTADAHPMHFHLFNVQVLGRQRVDKTFLPKAPAVPPLPNEMGFKETVTVYPGECTIVAALVEDPMPGRKVTVTTAAGAVDCQLPFSPRLKAAYGLDADEYVWHCHILEHEEHDMMRPLVASE
jgi:spore coat protein A, manganese oxidase